MNIDVRDLKQQKEYNSLSRLVTSLFAVIFGVGLSQLSTLTDGYDGIVLVLAYVAVILSWWGYNWGIVLTPEMNVLNYVIDWLVIVVYWLLINRREPFVWVGGGYLARASAHSG